MIRPRVLPKGKLLAGRGRAEDWEMTIHGFCYNSGTGSFLVHRRHLAQSCSREPESSRSLGISVLALRPYRDGPPAQPLKVTLLGRGRGRRCSARSPVCAATLRPQREVRPFRRSPKARGDGPYSPDGSATSVNTVLDSRGGVSSANSPSKSGSGVEGVMKKRNRNRGSGRGETNESAILNRVVRKGPGTKVTSKQNLETGRSFQTPKQEHFWRV